MRGRKILELACFDMTVNHNHERKEGCEYLGGSLYVRRGESGEEGSHSEKRQQS